MSLNFDIITYAQNEINLGLAWLIDHPDDQSQKDRVAYWALRTGDIVTAEKYGTSPKLLGLIDEWKEKNA